MRVIEIIRYFFNVLERYFHNHILFFYLVILPRVYVMTIRFLKSIELIYKYI